MSGTVAAIRRAVRDALEDAPIVVLAVSGGVDSMVLLDAATAVLSASRIVVATFDHATGVWSARAASSVVERALALGVTAVAGCRDRDTVEDGPETEAAWRRARWRFLRDVAARTGGAVVTAHTRDDQIETVLMRVLRDAGARGLAALAAESDVRRPLLGIGRADIERYAAARELAWLEDPTNRELRHLRNRVRHEVLPALRRVRPAIDRELLDVAGSAAAWRREVEWFVERAVPYRLRPIRMGDDADSAHLELDVDSRALLGYSRQSLALLWPALAALAGVVLDRRGTRRLAAFTTEGRIGSRVQVSGGWEVARSREHFALRPLRERLEATAARRLGGPAAGEVRWGGGRWVFSPVDGRDGTATSGESAWQASLPADRPLVVRAWRPGDAMTFRAGRPARKVKRFLTEAGITGRDRVGWPVVLAGDEIVWIPGACRSEAATERSGRPAADSLTYRCGFRDR